METFGHGKLTFYRRRRLSVEAASVVSNEREESELNSAFEEQAGQLIIAIIKGIQRGFNTAPRARD